jgi:hypothetical protein
MKRLFLAACVALVPFTAPAWDAAGHMLVGEIAWQNLKPTARARVSELVKPLETTYNEKQTYNFVTATCWMDDMKGLKKGYLWGKWHYVDIAYTPSGSPCPIPTEGENIVWAIGENLKTLRNSAAKPEEQTQAMAMLIHFVGDIHQPLHAADWNDRGGNDFLIAGVPFTDLFPHSAANLHTLWDKGFRFDAKDNTIVELWQSPKIPDRPKAPGEGIIGEQAKKIMEAFPAESLIELKRPNNAEQWACESHTIACLFTYPVGPHPTNAEVIKLPPDYIHRAGQILQVRVALAGYRLAQVLNELYAPESAPAAAVH